MDRGSSKAGRGSGGGGGNSVTSLNGITDGSNEQNLAWVKEMRPGISEAEAQARRDRINKANVEGLRAMYGVKKSTKNTTPKKSDKKR